MGRLNPTHLQNPWTLALHPQHNTGSRPMEGKGGAIPEGAVPHWKRSATPPSSADRNKPAIWRANLHSSDLILGSTAASVQGRTHRCSPIALPNRKEGTEMMQSNTGSDVVPSQELPHKGGIGPQMADLRHAVLVEGCLRERDAFASRRPVDGSWGRELFRRALALRQERAWAAIVDVYGGQVRRWVLRHQGFALLGLEVDEVAFAAYARMWQALSGDRMPANASLAGLLRYLRTCVDSEIVQCLRDLARRSRVDWVHPDQDEEASWEELRESADSAGVAMEDGVVQAQVWDAALRSLPDEREQLVLACSFADGIPPREIAALHPTVFGDAAHVSQVKENVLRRLRRERNALARAA